MVIIQPIVTTILIVQYNSEAQINTTLMGKNYICTLKLPIHRKLSYYLPKKQVHCMI